jgi:hypothetical protein
MEQREVVSTAVRKSFPPVDNEPSWRRVHGRCAKDNTLAGKNTGSRTSFILCLDRNGGMRLSGSSEITKACTEERMDAQGREPKVTQAQ